MLDFKRHKSSIPAFTYPTFLFQAKTIFTMIEVRFHGRGGQGAVTAASLLADAVFRDGKFPQATPSFGPERRGAPVESYCRISDRFIRTRENIYNPDFVVVLDSGLLDVIDVSKGMKPGGVVVINSPRNPDLKFRTFFCDAMSIAMKEIKRPIVNTAMLGAFAKASGLVSLKSLEDSIRENFPQKIVEANISAVKKAYEEVKE